MNAVSVNHPSLNYTGFLLREKTIKFSNALSTICCMCCWPAKSPDAILIQYKSGISEPEIREIVRQR